MFEAMRQRRHEMAAMVQKTVPT